MIVIADTAWSEMVSHSEADFPDECCGILLGRQDDRGHRIAATVRCANNAGVARRKRFLIDPEELLEARRQAASAGLDIAGFYHSHPGKGPYFSESDLQDCWPGYANIVLSVIRGRFRAARGYCAGPARQRAEPLQIVRSGQIRQP